MTDGQGYFSRPSPRLVDSLELLAYLFHPGGFEPPDVALLPFEVASRR